MDFIYAIILGVVQGLTEFLPVSSSGHLAIVGKYLDMGQPGILFEVLLHAGTLLAVVWYLRNRILKLSGRDVWLVFIATIPVALVGMVFRWQIEGLFALLKLVGVAFLVTAVLNYQTDKTAGKREEPDTFDAIFIGLMQAVAVIPGISRSGATIFAGSKMNLTKTKAAEFSFLLSVPAIIGANILEFAKYGNEGDFSIGLGIVGLVSAFLSGLFAINLLMNLLTSRSLKIFSVYLVIVGVLTVLFL